MTHLCTEKERSDNVATILEHIPRSDEDAVVLRSLCPGKDSPSCAGCTGALLTVLEMFDAVTIIEDNKGKETRVKARSEAGTYFFRSLAAYVRKHFTLVSNWERQRAGEDLPAIQTLALGTQFVYLMEQRRIAELKDTSPIREELVSHAIVKARIKGKREPVYLVQYDEKARRFQLIGGRRRRKDKDGFDTMVREIEEELAMNHLQYSKDYDLRELVNSLEHTAISPTYGAYTKYNFTVFQAFMTRRQLTLGPNDRWVTLKELLCGPSKEKAHPPDEYLSKLDDKLPGGFDGLKLSLDEVQKRPLREIAVEKKWELTGLAIGIASIAIAVLFWLFPK